MMELFYQNNAGQNVAIDVGRKAPSYMFERVFNTDLGNAPFFSLTTPCNIQ